MRHVAGLLLATAIPATFLTVASVGVILCSHAFGNVEKIMPFVGGIWSFSFLILLAATFGYIGDTLLNIAHSVTEKACQCTIACLGAEEAMKSCHVSPKQPHAQAPTMVAPDPRSQWSI